MARTIQKITLNQAENIPFDKLVLSQKNVRRVKNGVSIDDLAEDIARRGLLQSLNVRIERGVDGHETGRYEVPAGGRRFMACERLIAQKRMAGTAPVPCIVNRAESTSAEEDSLAENVHREQLHPLDQFRAFRALSDQGLDIEEIAARFFVSTATVRQRLKLATVSPKLLDLYGEDKIRLEQLMAMSICDDHARQEQVWERVCGSHMQDPYAIKRLLTETTVRADDRRAVYVGEEAYEACGGSILRDLFEQDGGGWFQDAALLEQLVFEKLNADAEAIRSEGWKWVEAAISFPYGHASGLRRIYGRAREPSAEEVERHEALKAEYDRIDADYAEADDYDEATEDRLEKLGEKIDAFNDRPEVFGADQMAIAGVFVTLAADGRVQVERGFVRPEDEPRTEPGDADQTGRAEPDTDVSGKSGIAGSGAADSERLHDGPADDDGEDEEAVRPLSDRLVQDLTAERTLALRNALAADPDVAFVAALHAMVLQLFYRFASGSCLEISLKSTGFPQVQGLGETIWASEIADRHEGWDRDLPDEERDLWDFLLRLDETSRKSLFAHCIALTLNVVIEPWNRRPRALAHGDVVAGALGFDMVSAGWTAGVDNYLGKVTKARILEAVRQACGEDAAQQIGHLKKPDMAKAAARLLEGSNWLPEPLRNREPPSCADDRGGEQSAGNDEASGHPSALSDEERGSDPMMAAAE